MPREPEQAKTVHRVDVALQQMPRYVAPHKPATLPALTQETAMRKDASDTAELCDGRPLQEGEYVQALTERTVDGQLWYLVECTPFDAPASIPFPFRTRRLPDERAAFRSCS